MRYKPRLPIIPTSLVKEVEITPLEPRSGDLINITFKGECDERIPVELKYEQIATVVDGEYAVQMNRIQVPWPKNSLSIEAKNVETMNVAAKILLWISKKAEVMDNVGRYVLTDVAKGNYTVKVNGTAPPGVTSVAIKITALSDLQLDATGSGVYTLQSHPENTGNLAIKCLHLKQSVDIKKKEE
jgi:hypothetical protein